MRSREWDQEQNGPPAPKIKPTHSRVFDTNSPFAVLVKNTHDLIVTTFRIIVPKNKNRFLRRRPGTPSLPFGDSTRVRKLL